MIDSTPDNLPESAVGVAEVFAEVEEFFDQHPEVVEKLEEHGIITDSND